MKAINSLHNILFVFCFSISFLSAQEGISYHFYPEMAQQNIINSVQDSSAKFSVSGMGYTHLLSNSISIGDISILNGNERTIDLDLAKDLIKDQNLQEFSSELNLIHIEYYLDKMTLKGGYNQKNYLQVSYPRELYSLLADGNAQFIGQQVTLSPSAEISALHEFYGGISLQLSNLRIGANLKFISGISNLHTERNLIQLETSDDIYQLGLNTDVELLTSGVLTYNSYDDVILEFNRAGFSGMFLGNYGFGIDLGLDYSLSEKTRVFSSVQNIGSVLWDLRGTSYKSEGESRYEGIDIIDYLGIDDSASFRDSLEALLEVVETDVDYTAATPFTIVAGFQHKLGASFDIGALVNSRSIAGQRDNAIGINIRKQLKNWLTIGSSYTNRFGTYDNVGLSAMIEYKGMKGLVLTENIMSVFDPLGKRNFSLAGGFSISF